MNRLKAVMLLLIANDAPLGPERRDHALKGSWVRYRECHIWGDFLLIYRIDDTDGSALTPNYLSNCQERLYLRFRSGRPDGMHCPIQ